jgi:hypothetical protein
VAPEDAQGTGSTDRNQEQYERLIECSEAEDISGWNIWREDDPDAPIGLAEIRFEPDAWLQEVDLHGANLTDATFDRANMQRADLRGATLLRASFKGAHLEEAVFDDAHLQDAKLTEAHLEGAQFRRTRLERADFSYAIVDGATLIQTTHVDSGTCFWGTPIGNVRMIPGLRRRLEANVRRRYWNKWCERHTFCQWVVRPFRWLVGYRRSMARLAAVIAGLTVVFGVVHWIGSMSNPPCVTNLRRIEGEQEDLPEHLVAIRALYFSIVTTTTLGLGDIAAHPHNMTGHVLVAFQVVLSYVLLGLLIARLAVLSFQLGGRGPLKDAESG